MLTFKRKKKNKTILKKKISPSRHTNILVYNKQNILESLSSCSMQRSGGSSQPRDAHIFSSDVCEPYLNVV